MNAKNLRALIAHIRSLGDRGLLEAGQLQEIERGIRKLRAALKSQDKRAIEAAVNQVAKAVLRNR
jgi:argininosuccinate lyase